MLFAVFEDKELLITEDLESPFIKWLINYLGLYSKLDEFVINAIINKFDKLEHGQISRPDIQSIFWNNRNKEVQLEVRI